MQFFLLWKVLSLPGLPSNSCSFKHGVNVWHGVSLSVGSLVPPTTLCNYMIAVIFLEDCYIFALRSPIQAVNSFRTKTRSFIYLIFQVLCITVGTEKGCSERVMNPIQSPHFMEEETAVEVKM